MQSDDLRTLAQAVVDTSDEADRSIFAPAADIAAENAARELGQALGYPRGADATVSTARAILAALDAERAQGYARAMGEVVERCDRELSERRGHVHLTQSALAFASVADWARERLPAAAEKEHEK